MSDGLADRRTYDEGVRQGKMIALETVQALHASRLDGVEKRIGTLERVAYTLIGAIALVQFSPAIESFLS